MLSAVTVIKYGTASGSLQLSQVRICGPECYLMQQHAAAAPTCCLRPVLAGRSVISCYSKWLPRLLSQTRTGGPYCYLMLQHAAAVPFISLAARQLPVLLSHDQPGMRCHVSFWARDNGLELQPCVCRAFWDACSCLSHFCCYYWCIGMSLEAVADAEAGCSIVLGKDWGCANCLAQVELGIDAIS